MNPKLIISQKMFDVISHLAEKPLEWTAFGEITEEVVEGGMEFRLEEIYFPEQTNSKAETDIGKDVLAKMGPVLRKKGVNTSRIKLWIHSHNSMATSPSGTDVQQMEDFKNDSFYLGMIVSSTNKWSTRMSLFNPVRLELPLDLEFERELTPQEILDGYQKSLEAVEIAEKPYMEEAKGGKWMPLYVVKELKDNPMTTDETEAFYDYIELGYTREACMRFIVDNRDIVKGNKLNHK